MKLSIKNKIITLYIVIGMVWCIIGLPNLLSTSGNRVWKAIIIAFIRIFAWPILIIITISKYTKLKHKVK